MKSNNRRQAPSTAVPARRGAVVIIAMIALLLASIIGAGLLKTALLQRRLAIRDQHRLQSEWLAESGVERAAAQLARNADYKGETWNLPAAELGGKYGGTVVIEVVPIASSPNRRRVTVVADYPEQSSQRSRSRKVITLERKP